MSLKIVADENIPHVKQAFDSIGSVQVVPGRALNAQAVKDADILLVRSISRVDKPLLDGSRIRFVATATIGTDHIDQEYLRQRGIGFASAPGSNSNSVAEYVLTALLVLAERGGWELVDKTVGVVGVGNVGSKVVAKCRQLGMTVLENDPPLQQVSGNQRFVSLAQLLGGSDIVTVHVPLSVDTQHATSYLISQDFIDRLRPDAVVINTSRGAVADGEAVKRALQGGKIHSVLDVWENEPNIDVQLVKLSDLGSAHVAGYSMVGKINGLEMIYNAACKHFDLQANWNSLAILPAVQVAQMHLQCAGRTDQQILAEAVLKVYDIEADDADLRAIDKLLLEKRGPYFDQLRKAYRVRREFFNTTIICNDAGAPLLAKLQALGFETTTT